MVQEEKLAKKFLGACPQLFVRPPIAMRAIRPGKKLHPPSSFALIDMLPSKSPVAWIERLRK